MTYEEATKALAFVRDKIAQQGRIVDDRLLTKEKQLVAFLDNCNLSESLKGE